MKRTQAPNGGLVEAQARITGLMGELDDTLDLVRRLSARGDEEIALILLDRQREALHQAINTISRDVATTERRGRWAGIRRQLAAIGTAAALVVSSIAVSVAAFNRTDPVEAATQQLDRAEQIADPVERLRIYLTVVEQSKTLPAQEREQLLDDELLEDLTRTADEAGDDADADLTQQAERAIEDIKDGRQPTPPTAPGSDQGPVETIEDLLGDG